jgi:hypothetical protein
MPPESAWALGLGLVVLILTLGIALYKGIMVRALRRALPFHWSWAGSWMKLNYQNGRPW